jgi:hypothetical protein
VIESTNGARLTKVIQAQGFQLERVERLKWGIVERLAARKPA